MTPTSYEPRMTIWANIGDAYMQIIIAVSENMNINDSVRQCKVYGSYIGDIMTPGSQFEKTY